MKKGRLEAFSDGVMAIIITIMVLELKPPHQSSLEGIFALWPKFISYVLSFIYIAIYWNNHHHMFHATRIISGKVLWLNAHLLFWLSLIPFATAWMGENNFEKIPTALYGSILFFCAVSYFLLSTALTKLHGHDSDFSRAIKGDFKGRISLVIYLLGIGLTFITPMIGFIMYVTVAVIWFIPDKRFESFTDD